MEKEIQIVKELLEGVRELNGEYQEGWDETIKQGEELLKHLEKQNSK